MTSSEPPQLDDKHKKTLANHNIEVVKELNHDNFSRIYLGSIDLKKAGKQKETSDTNEDELDTHLDEDMKQMTGQKCAIKYFLYPKEKEKKVKEIIKVHEEVARHPNIVSILKVVWLGDHSMAIVMELSQFGSLRKLVDDIKNNVKRMRRLKQAQFLRMVHEMTAGLKVLHKHGRAHRNVSADNVLIFRDSERVLHPKWIGFSPVVLFKGVKHGTDQEKKKFEKMQVDDTKKLVEIIRWLADEVVDFDDGEDAKKHVEKIQKEHGL